MIVSFWNSYSSETDQACGILYTDQPFQMMKWLDLRRQGIGLASISEDGGRFHSVTWWIIQSIFSIFRPCVEYWRDRLVAWFFGRIPDSASLTIFMVTMLITMVEIIGLFG